MMCRRAAFLCDGEPAAAVTEHKYPWRQQPVSGSQSPVQHSPGQKLAPEMVVIMSKLDVKSESLVAYKSDHLQDILLVLA